MPVPSGVRKPSGAVVRRQPLYDSRVVVTAKAQQYDFFKTIVGGSEDTIVKTIFHTNLETAGQTPSDQPFKVTGLSIGAYSKNEISFDDMKALIFNAQAWLRFEIRREVVLEIPLFKIPTGTGMYVSSTTDTDKTFSSNGIPSEKNYFDLGKRARVIDALSPFTMFVRYDTAPVIVATDLRLFVFLHGSMVQPAS